MARAVGRELGRGQGRRDLGGLCPASAAVGPRLERDVECSPSAACTREESSYYSTRILQRRNQVRRVRKGIFITERTFFFFAQLHRRGTPSRACGPTRPPEPGGKPPQGYPLLKQRGAPSSGRSQRKPNHTTQPHGARSIERTVTGAVLSCTISSAEGCGDGKPLVNRGM